MRAARGRPVAVARSPELLSPATLMLEGRRRARPTSAAVSKNGLRRGLARCKPANTNLAQEAAMLAAATPDTRVNTWRKMIARARLFPVIAAGTSFVADELKAFEV